MSNNTFADKLEQFRLKHAQFRYIANRYATYQQEQWTIHGTEYIPKSFLKWEEDEDFKRWLEETK